MRVVLLAAAALQGSERLLLLPRHRLLELRSTIMITSPISIEPIGEEEESDLDYRKRTSRDPTYRGAPAAETALEEGELALPVDMAVATAIVDVKAAADAATAAEAAVAEHVAKVAAAEAAAAAEATVVRSETGQTLRAAEGSSVVRALRLPVLLLLMASCFGPSLAPVLPTWLLAGCLWLQSLLLLPLALAQLAFARVFQGVVHLLIVVLRSTSGGATGAA